MTFPAAPVQSTDEACSADTVSPSPKVLAEIFDYSHLIAAFRNRANELKIARSHENTANIFGFTTGYFQKLLAPKPPRRIGLDTLGPMLGVIGAKLLLVADDAALARLARIGASREDMKLKERNNNLVHDGVKHITITRRQMQKIGRKGGKARMRELLAKGRLAGMQRKAGKARANSQTPAQRSALGRKANLIRWNDVRSASNGSLK